MERRGNDSENRDSTASDTTAKTAERAKAQLPIDFDDIIAIAILDSALRVKRRKSKSRTPARRPKF
jgi:hypothetical protein